MIEVNWFRIFTDLLFGVVMMVLYGRHDLTLCLLLGVGSFALVAWEVLYVVCQVLTCSYYRKIVAGKYAVEFYKSDRIHPVSFCRCETEDEAIMFGTQRLARISEWKGASSEMAIIIRPDGSSYELNPYS